MWWALMTACVIPEVPAPRPLPPLPATSIPATCAPDAFDDIDLGALSLGDYTALRVAAGDPDVYVIEAYAGEQLLLSTASASVVVEIDAPGGTLTLTPGVPTSFYVPALDVPAGVPTGLEIRVTTNAPCATYDLRFDLLSTACPPGPYDQTTAPTPLWAGGSESGMPPLSVSSDATDRFQLALPANHRLEIDSSSAVELTLSGTVPNNVTFPGTFSFAPQPEARLVEVTVSNPARGCIPYDLDLTYQVESACLQGSESEPNDTIATAQDAIVGPFVPQSGFASPEGDVWRVVLAFGEGLRWDAIPAGIDVFVTDARGTVLSRDPSGVQLENDFSTADASLYLHVFGSDCEPYTLDLVPADTSLTGIPELCGNGVDDNSDGRIDECCDGDVPPATFALDQTYQFQSVAGSIPLTLPPGAAAIVTHARGYWEDGSTTGSRFHNPSNSALPTTLEVLPGSCVDLRLTSICPGDPLDTDPLLQGAEPRDVRLTGSNVHTYPLDVVQPGRIALQPLPGSGGYEQPVLSLYHRGVTRVGRRFQPVLQADDTVATVMLTSGEPNACGPYRLQFD